MATTATEQQRNILFGLLQTQLSNGLQTATRAETGEQTHYKAACHLLGIAGYIEELAHQIKSGMEMDK